MFTPQVIAVVPLLGALGVAFSLHLINHFSEEVENRPPKAALKKIISTTGKAVLLSAVTTMVGFASLLSSNIPPITNIGLAFLIGMIYCFLSTMVLVPSLLLIFRYKKRIKKGWRVFARVVDYRKQIIFVLTFITFISIIVIPSVSTETSLWAMMPENMDSSKAMNKYSEQMESGQQGAFYVGVKNGDVLEPPILEKIDSVEKMINNNIENAAAYSIVDLIKSLNLGNREEIPETREKVERLLERWVGETELRMMLNDDYTKALVYVDIPTMSVEETEQPVEEIDNVLEQFDDTYSGEVSLFTGTAPILIIINNMLMGEQFQFMFVSLALVFLCLLIVFRSFRYALFTFVPILLILLWEPGLLVISGIPLDIATIMVSSVAIGAGIDFSVHITQRVRDELKQRSALDAVKVAVARKSIPLIEATIALIAGGIPMFLMDYRMISQFVLIVLVMLSFACVTALLALPSIYAVKNGRWLEKWGK
jgi:predicted RND superfamily exporter protein